jgi:hypothetical protein
MATESGDHAQHQNHSLAPQVTGDEMQGLKEILVSLQGEIARCLQKLEMGWENKGKGKVGNGLKYGENKGVGPGLNQFRSMEEPKPIWKQPIIKYYRQTYVRRGPRRQLRWSPKPLGRLEVQATGGSTEVGRSSSPEESKVTDQAEEPNNGSLDPTEVELEETDSADDSAGDSKSAEMISEYTETLEKNHIGEIEVMGQRRGEAPQLPVNAGNIAGDSAVIENAPDSTDTLDRIFIGAIENMGQSLGKVSEAPASAGDRDRDITVNEKGTVSTENADLGVMIVVQPTEYYENGKEEERGEERETVNISGEEYGANARIDMQGEVFDGIQRGTGACTVYEGGSFSGYLVNVEGEKFIDVPLEIEPLEAYPECPEGKVCEWVIERVKGMCHVWGMSCEGYEGELEKLFRKIEGNRGKAFNPAATPTKSTVKGNRELRGLQTTMNYDGKMGKENRGKKQKQRARGGGLLCD